MFLGLLCLGFALLGATQTQAASFQPKRIPAPPLSTIPVRQNFEAKKFQGKWYLIGVAGNAIKKGRIRSLPMSTTTFDLKEDGSYNVTSFLLREYCICDSWVRSFVPTSLNGEFTLKNIESHRIQSYIVRVTGTTYTGFAIVFFKKVVRNQEFFKINLYGRTKELSSSVKEVFTLFSKTTGLTDKNIIFTTPIDKCIDGN